MEASAFICAAKKLYFVKFILFQWIINSIIEHPSRRVQRIPSYIFKEKC
jgi:hypothetical protein